MVGPVKIDAPAELTKEQAEIARVLADPGQWVHRLYWDEDWGGTTYEELHCWQARALLAYSDAFLKRRVERPCVPIEDPPATMDLYRPYGGSE